jgi:hypothetical protein
MAWGVMPLKRGPKDRNYGFEISYPKMFREPVFCHSDIIQSMLLQDLYLLYENLLSSCWRV